MYVCIYIYIYIHFGTTQPTDRHDYEPSCPAPALLLLGNFASQDFYIILRDSWKFCGELRRRRIRATTAQTNVKVLAREISYIQTSLSRVIRNTAA